MLFRSRSPARGRRRSSTPTRRRTTRSPAGASERPAASRFAALGRGAPARRRRRTTRGARGSTPHDAPCPMQRRATPKRPLRLPSMMAVKRPTASLPSGRTLRAFTAAKPSNGLPTTEGLREMDKRLPPGSSPVESCVPPPVSATSARESPSFHACSSHHLFGAPGTCCRTGRRTGQSNRQPRRSGAKENCGLVPFDFPQRRSPTR